MQDIWNSWKMVFLRLIGLILVVQGLPARNSNAATIKELETLVESESDINENLKRPNRDQPETLSSESQEYASAVSSDQHPADAVTLTEKEYIRLLRQEQHSKSHRLALQLAPAANNVRIRRGNSGSLKKEDEPSNVPADVELSESELISSEKKRDEEFEEVKHNNESSSTEPAHTESPQHHDSPKDGEEVKHSVTETEPALSGEPHTAVHHTNVPQTPEFHPTEHYTAVLHTNEPHPHIAEIHPTEYRPSEHHTAVHHTDVPNSPEFHPTEHYTAEHHTVESNPTEQQTAELHIAEIHPTEYYPSEHHTAVAHTAEPYPTEHQTAELHISEIHPIEHHVPLHSSIPIENESVSNPSSSPTLSHDEKVIVKVSIPKCPTILDVASASKAVTEGMRKAEGLQVGLGVVLNAASDSLSSVVGCLGKIISDFSEGLKVRPHENTERVATPER